MSANPYFSLLSYSATNFVGREDTIRLTLESLDRIGPLALFGLPGMGKSTILRFLADKGVGGAMQQFVECLPPRYRGSEHSFLPVRVEFRKRPLHMHPFEYLHLRMRQECKAHAVGVDPTGDAVSVLHEDSQTGGSDRWAGQLDIAIRMLVERNIRPVLLLDDFDLAYGELSFEETSWMRPWREFAAFILATERRLEDVNPDAMGSPFWGNVMMHRLGPLRRKDSEALFNKGRGMDPKRTEWPQECVDLTLELAGGHPYLVIMGGLALWELEEKAVVGHEVPSVRDYETLLRGRLQADFRRTFHMYRERLDLVERRALLTLARGEPMTEAQKIRLAALVELGLVEEDTIGSEPGFRLFSSAFRDFLVESGAAPDSTAPVLTENERRIHIFMRRRLGETCTFQDLWAASSDEGQSRPPEDVVAAVQTAISRLRPKLKISTGEDIVSVRNQGYRLVSPSG